MKEMKINFFWLLIITLIFFSHTPPAWASPSAITGVEIAGFADREVVVIRHEGYAELMKRFQWDEAKRELSIIIDNASLDKTLVRTPKLKLVRYVNLSPILSKNQVLLTVGLRDPSVVKENRLRGGEYSKRLIVLEFFPAGVPTGTDKRVKEVMSLMNRTKDIRSTSELLLRPEQEAELQSDPKRLYELLSSEAGISFSSKLTVISDSAGSISTERGRSAIDSILTERPLNEIVFLARQKDLSKIREVLTRISKEKTTPADGLENQTLSSSMGTRPDAEKDSGVGIADNDYPPIAKQSSRPDYRYLKSQLSDVLVDLNAAQGLNLYATLMLLSEISGVSIIIDPYITDEPTGSRRGRKIEPPGSGGEGQGPSEGFRDASRFEPSLLQGGSRTIVGNLRSVPFELALDIILESHDLDYLVFSTPESNYTKPVILVSSKERIEQEIRGANKVEFYQPHYADPDELYRALDAMGVLPSRVTGWYVYRGGQFGGIGGGYGGGFGRGGGLSGGGGMSGGAGGGPYSGLLPDTLNLDVPQNFLLEFDPERRYEQVVQILKLIQRNEDVDLLSVRFAPSQTREPLPAYRMLVAVL